MPKSRRRNPVEFGVSKLSSKNGKHRSQYPLDLETYTSAKLAEGLNISTTYDSFITTSSYTQAACELALVFERCFLDSPKNVTSEMANDATLAVSQIKNLKTSEQLFAADRVYSVAKKLLPKEKRSHLETDYKRVSVVRKRRAKRRNGGGENENNYENNDDASNSDENYYVPKTIHDLPIDVLGLVLDKLDPYTLSKACCVSREWRTRVATANEAWQNNAIVCYGEKKSERAYEKIVESSSTDDKSLSNDSTKTSWYRTFLSLRTRYPDKAPAKVTGRAWCAKCRSLRWHDWSTDFDKLRCGCRFEFFGRSNSYATREAVAFTAPHTIATVSSAQAVQHLIRNARRSRRAGYNNNSVSDGWIDSGSDLSSSESSESDAENVGQRRLWQ